MIWESRHIPNPNRAHLSWFPAVKVRISESHMLMEAEKRPRLGFGAATLHRPPFRPEGQLHLLQVYSYASLSLKFRRCLSMLGDACSREAWIAILTLAGVRRPGW